MKHFKELFALRSKIYDGRTTKKSMMKAAERYVQLFESRDELAIELNEYETNYPEWSLPNSVTIPLGRAALTLPNEQTIPWRNYELDLGPASFVQFCNYIEELYAQPGFDRSDLDIYREYFEKGDK